jgi:hypothetical protein
MSHYVYFLGKVAVPQIQIPRKVLYFSVGYYLIFVHVSHFSLLSYLIMISVSRLYTESNGRMIQEWWTFKEVVVAYSRYPSPFFLLNLCQINHVRLFYYTSLWYSFATQTMKILWQHGSVLAISFGQFAVFSCHMIGAVPVSLVVFFKTFDPTTVSSAL